MADLFDYSGNLHFTLRLSKENYILRDHIVMNQNCLPGVTYFELICSYLKSQNYNLKNIGFENVLFLNPVKMDKMMQKDVSIVLEREKDKFRAKGSSENKDIFQMDIVRMEKPKKHIDIEKIKKEAVRVVDLEEAYRRTRMAQIVHYEFMKLHGEAYQANGSVLAHVMLSDFAKKFKEVFTLHPAILDGSTVASSLLTMELNSLIEESQYLPFCIEKFYVMDRLCNEEYYIYANAENTKNAQGGIMYNTIEIYDANGDLAGIYEQFGTKLIRNPNAIAKNQQQEKKDIEETAKRNEASMEEWLRGEAERIIGRKILESEMNTSFFDLGMDSSQLLAMESSLEKKFDRNFYPTLLFEYPDLSQLAGFLKESGCKLPYADSNTMQTKKQVEKHPVNESLEDSIRDMICEMIEEMNDKKLDKTDYTIGFYELGLDSSDLINLEKKLEDWVGEELYPTLLFEYSTIQELSNYLNENYGKEILDKNFELRKEKEKEKEPATVVENIKVEKKLANMLYSLIWKSIDINSYRVHTKLRGRTLAVCTDQSLEFAVAWRKSILDTDVTIVCITDSVKADADTKEITYLHPDNINQFEDIYRSLDGLTSVVFFNGMELRYFEQVPSEKEFEQISKTGIQALFSCMKVIQNCKIKSMKQITVLTNNANSVEGEAECPYHASFHGFLRSIEKEMSEISFTVLDFDCIGTMDDTKKQFLFDLINEIPQSGGVELFVRGEKAYIKDVKQIGVFGNKTRFRQHGVYVIIGGNGGIGKKLSKYLAVNYQASIIWIGRRKECQQYESFREEVTRFGGSLSYVSCDVQDSTAFRYELDQIEKSNGSINGIFHSALVLDDKLLINMDMASLNKVLGPKTQGLLSLYYATMGRKLDFISIFSSVQTLLGNVGQSNYAAAGAFEDAFADLMRKKLPFDVKVINWGMWDNTGVASDAKFQHLAVQTGMALIKEEEGMPFIDKMLSSSWDQVYTINFYDTTLEKIGIEYGKEKTVPIEYLTIEKDYPSRRFQQFWREYTKGNKSIYPKTDVNLELQQFIQDGESRLFHMLVHGERFEQMETTVCGAGKKVLLFNGFGLTQAQWYFQFQELKYYQFININIPGVGLSYSDTEVDFESICRVFMEVLEQIGADQDLILLGTSFGGMVAQVFAAMYPERVKALILASSFLHIKLDSSDNGLAGLVENDFKNIGLEHLFPYIMDAQMVNGELSKYEPYIEAGFDARNYAAKVKCPVYLIKGDKDSILSEELVEELADMCHPVKSYTITGAGHAPYISHKHEFNMLIDNILKKLN